MPYPDPLPSAGGRTVLVVDDEPVIRKLARAALGAAGFAVVEADDGDSAAEKIRRAVRPFDLVLLDLSLGEISGAKLIPMFRRETPTSKILVVSGSDPEEAEGFGVDGFLPKPFNKTSLLMTVWRILSLLPSPPEHE